MRRAVVLGGGVAGLRAAFALRDRGFAVELCEAHGWLGGRAFSFCDHRMGTWLDNGPHVILGCYDAMRRLLRRIGTEGAFERGRSLELAYRERGGRRARLRLCGLPVPLALPWGLLALPLGLRGRLGSLRGMLASLRRPREGMTVAGWLRRHGQLCGPERFLWVPLCRAVMNAEPEEVDAGVFLATLREAFAGGPARAAIWLPRRTWIETVGIPARRQLEAEGIGVRDKARVTHIERTGNGGARVRLGRGEALTVGPPDVLVSALPWHVLARVLPGLPGQAGSGLGGAPLVTVHFRCREAEPLADDGPLVCLVDGDPFHFLCRVPGGPPGEFAVLAGGCRQLDGVPVAEIEARARRQLAAFDPRWPEDAPAAVRVSKESRATYVAAPGSEAMRPPPGRLRVPGAPDNLHVCGDWTAVGLPSTLEGAARSAEWMVESLE